MNHKRARRFQIEISFGGLRGRVMLDIVSVYAETEQEALELARAHTSYTIGGADRVAWKVREPAASHGKMTT